MIILLLIFLISYRKHFGIGNNPLDYLSIILDCYSIFEIYVCVGFFVLQLLKDYKMSKNNKDSKSSVNKTSSINEKSSKYSGLRCYR